VTSVQLVLRDKRLWRRCFARTALLARQHHGDFAGHSLRRGHATTAARNGASERTIMRTTGHTSTQTVRGYIEDGELFSDPASKYLGL